MEFKEVIKIINEEISDFDFLGNDEYQKEKENIDLLSNEEFQKRFICDSLLNKNVKIEVYDSRIGGNWEGDIEDANSLSIEYYLIIDYKYDQTKEPIKFNLDFTSDDVGISMGERTDRGTYDTPPSAEAWFNYFNWSDIDVTLSTADGDQIDFVAFKKAPMKIQSLFIKHYTIDYIYSYTGADFRTSDAKDSVKNVPYC